MHTNNNKHRFGTNLIHANTGIDGHFGAVNVPIYQVSTFNQEDETNNGRYDYSRSGNPTREALENTIAQLENGYAGFAFHQVWLLFHRCYLFLNQEMKF